MTPEEMDLAAHNILQAESHLLGGDLIELMSQQHELQQQQKHQQKYHQETNQQPITSQTVAQQLNPSTIEEEQTAEQGVFLATMDSHTPTHDFSDEEEDTKL